MRTKTNIQTALRTFVHSPVCTAVVTAIVAFGPLAYVTAQLVSEVTANIVGTETVRRTYPASLLTAEDLVRLMEQRKEDRLEQQQLHLVSSEQSSSVSSSLRSAAPEVEASFSSSSSSASIDWQEQSSVSSLVEQEASVRSVSERSSIPAASSSVRSEELVSVSEISVESSTSSSIASSEVTVAEEVFPAFGRAVHPVSRVPNWGAMTSAREWDRSYADMPDSAYVSVPNYSIADLQRPMSELLANRKENEALITAKLYYSTRHFGRYDLDSGEYEWIHAGIDLKLPLGTPFGSIAGGKVFAVRTDATLGLHVIIEHRLEDEVYYSIYGHMQSVAVEVGDAVTSGQYIGTVGNSGASHGAHIHLQVNRNDPDWRSHQVYTEAEASQYTIHPIDFIRRY